MTWIKLDDRAPRHPKIAGLSDRGFRWWIHGLCYASEFLTDGALPRAFVSLVPGKIRQELTGAGLWQSEGDALVIHDYLTHQSSRESVERERERNRNRRRGSTGGTPTGNPAQVPRPEIREQRSETEEKPAASQPRTRPQAAGAGAGTYPRDHIDHGFCGRFCVSSRVFERMVRGYGEDGDAAVTGFLQGLSDGLKPGESAGSTVWVLEHFDAWLAQSGRVPKAGAKADWKAQVLAGPRREVRR